MEKRFRILFVGHGLSNFTERLAFHLKNENSNIKIDILSLTKIRSDYYNVFDNIYENNILHGINESTPFLLKKIIVVKNTVRMFFLFKKIHSNYDVINFHFIFPSLVVLTPLIKRSKSNIIASLWGSDFYRKNTFNRYLDYFFYKKVDTITALTPDFIRDFSEIYNMKKISNKLKEVRFGIDMFKYIDNKTVKNEKINICIGTNGSPNQQHLDILLQLMKIKDKNKIKLIIPATYMLDEVYRKRLLCELDRCGFEYELVTNFLSYEDMAQLRLKTDILIQIQITDSFSGAMVEHLYAGSIVITGSWLPYSILKDKDILYYEIDNVIDLKKIIEKILQNIEEEKVLCRLNRSKIYDISSWECAIKSWNKIYFSK